MIKREEQSFPSQEIVLEPDRPLVAPSADGPGWCHRLVELREALHTTRIGPEQDRILAEAWMLLSSAMLVHLRDARGSLFGFSGEDLEDIAAEKAFDLLVRLQSGAWDPRGHPARSISAYLRSCARRGLFGLLPARVRRRNYLKDAARQAGPAGGGGFRTKNDSPEISLDQGEYARALRSCLQHLALRARRIWLLRVLCGLASREIGAHPMVSVRTPHVDVILSRARREISECMRTHGHAPEEIPPGCVARIWDDLEEVFASSW